VRPERARTVTAGVPGPDPAIADATGARAVDDAHTHTTVDGANVERRTPNAGSEQPLAPGPGR
jgi:hypothetical protein